MRIYKNFPEALSEIKRDVVEMGIKCHPKTYQDKVVADNPDFDTLELQNYIFTVAEPDFKSIPNVSQPWADAEWLERVHGIQGNPVNPGTAWELRPDVWKEFLDKNKQFAYTYSIRLSLYQQMDHIIKRINQDPDSRQLFISIWHASDIYKLGGISRVPCSLGYQIQIRKKKVNITYLQRSADLVTHFSNDVYLACRLQDFIAYSTDYEIGTYTHWIGSLHMFRKDGQGVF